MYSISSANIGDPNILAGLASELLRHGSESDLTPTSNLYPHMNFASHATAFRNNCKAAKKTQVATDAQLRVDTESPPPCLCKALSQPFLDDSIPHHEPF